MNNVQGCSLSESQKTLHCPHRAQLEDIVPDSEEDNGDDGAGDLYDDNRASFYSNLKADKQQEMEMDPKADENYPEGQGLFYDNHNNNIENQYENMQGKYNNLLRSMLILITDPEPPINEQSPDEDDYHTLNVL
jgi:hypothetical protein